MTTTPGIPAMPAAADPFGALHQRQQAQEQRANRLLELAQQWDGPIRQGLRRLAQELWPDRHLLQLVPVQRYRLRHQAGPESQIWWVEHDIPPYDRYWCTAYRVQLILDKRGGPRLTVQSGTASHRVTPLNLETLEMTLAWTAEDLPLMISREMGPAQDP